MSAPKSDVPIPGTGLINAVSDFKVLRSSMGAARTAVKLGEELLLVKESLPHGAWLMHLETIGFSTRSARRMMVCALRFHGRSEAFFDAVGNQTKLSELLMLDDEYIDAMEAGREVFGLTLESIKPMTARELRSAIREAIRQENGQAALPEKEPQAPATATVDREALIDRVVNDAFDPACFELSADELKIVISRLEGEARSLHAERRSKNHPGQPSAVAPGGAVYAELPMAALKPPLVAAQEQPEQVRMLSLFLQCDPKARDALLSMAELLAKT